METLTCDSSPNQNVDRDPLLSKVRDVVLQGWPNYCPSDDRIKPFIHRKNEFSTEDGCLLWGNRIVVPSAGQTKVMEELHIGHPGISEMKSLAPSFMWWPGIDSDIEEKVKVSSMSNKS